MARARCGDWRVLVRGVVSTLMVLAVEVPLCATVSMGGGELLVRTDALYDPTLQDVALISVLGRGPMLAVYGGASARWSNEVTNLNNLCLVLALCEKNLAVDPMTT